TYSQEVQTALGGEIVCLAVYGSAAGDDYVDPHSDVNLTIVVREVTGELLEALAPIVMRWERRHFAIPLVIERAFLDRARDVFPMELDDIQRQHRLLAGTDVLSDLAIDREALRRQCEKEARGKLLRLRALYLGTGGAAPAPQRALLGARTSNPTLLLHLPRRHGSQPPP